MDAKGLRVAYVSDIAGIGVEAEIALLCRTAAQRLRDAGAAVEEIAFDVSDGRDPYQAWRGLWMVGQQYANLSELERFGPNLRGNVQAGLKVTAIDIAAAEQKRWSVSSLPQAVRGHSVMKDALDIDGIYDAIRDAGLELPARPRAEDLGGRVVNCFMKCEADRRGALRGRRQIMLDDSDVHHHRHSKAAVGGVAAAAIGDPAVFVSVDAMHQGPQGGGPVIAIVDVGE